MWRSKLQDNYESLEEFKVYAETYGLHDRLGYPTPEAAWIANPWVQGSVNPGDFKKVDLRKKEERIHWNTDVEELTHDQSLTAASFNRKKR